MHPASVLSDLVVRITETIVDISTTVISTLISVEENRRILRSIVVEDVVVASTVVLTVLRRYIQQDEIRRIRSSSQ